MAELKLALARKEVELAQLRLKFYKVQADLVDLLGQQAQGQLTAAQRAEEAAVPQPAPPPLPAAPAKP